MCALHVHHVLYRKDAYYSTGTATKYSTVSAPQGMVLLLSLSPEAGRRLGDRGVEGGEGQGGGQQDSRSQLQHSARKDT